MPTRSLDDIVREVRDIASAFQEAGLAVDPMHPGNIGFSLFPRIDQRVDGCARDIVARNPGMLSHEMVSSTLRYIVLAGLLGGYLPDVFREGDDPDEFVRVQVKQFCDFSKTTDVEVPVLHLPLARGQELLWSGVTFRGLNPWGDLKGYKGFERLIDVVDGRFNGMATLAAPGDSMRVWRFVDETVGAALREIVGAAWLRHGGSGFTAPSVAGHGRDPGFAPMLVQGAREATSFLNAPGHPAFKVPADLIDDWDPEKYRELERIAQEEPSRRSEIEAAILSGLRWLGAASESDIPEMKLVKVATALESVVGERGRGGITATLAERSAFLVGKTPSEREETHELVIELYKKRSEVLHRGGEVQPNDLARYGRVVWRVCHAITGLLPELSQRNDLRKWTRNRRYAE